MPCIYEENRLLKLNNIIENNKQEIIKEELNNSHSTNNINNIKYQIELNQLYNNLLDELEKEILKEEKNNIGQKYKLLEIDIEKEKNRRRNKLFKIWKFKK